MAAPVYNVSQLYRISLTYLNIRVPVYMMNDLVYFGSPIKEHLLCNDPSVYLYLINVHVIFLNRENEPQGME